jgi:hypothetical protein
MKNVLTAKKARLLTLLAGKRGWDSLTNAFYFALFHVLVVFPPGNGCLSASSGIWASPKKSRQKTYRRFFDVRAWCYHRSMNDENEEFTRRNKEKMERWKESPRPPRTAPGRRRLVTAGHGWSRLITPSHA